MRVKQWLGVALCACVLGACAPSEKSLTDDFDPFGQERRIREQERIVALEALKRATPSKEYEAWAIARWQQDALDQARAPAQEIAKAKQWLAEITTLNQTRRQAQTALETAAPEAWKQYLKACRRVSTAEDLEARSCL